MLDVLRQHSSSMAVKIILGLIVVVFIFFFGSSSMRSNQGARRTVATVNGDPISSQLVAGMFQLQKDSNPLYKQLPESMMGSLKEGVLNSLIEETLLTQEARKLNLRVPDEELATEIRGNPQFIKNGQFDIASYNDNFRPGFLGTYGIEYEAWVRQSLLRSKLDAIFKDSYFTADTLVKEQAQIEGTTLKFKYIVISKASLENPEQTINQVISDLWPQFQKGSVSKELLEKYKVTEKESQELHLDELDQILGNQFDAEAVKSLLSLSKTNPLPPAPILINDQALLVRFIDKKVATADELSKNLEASKMNLAEAMPNYLLSRWSDELVKKASIKIHGQE